MSTIPRGMRFVPCAKPVVAIRLQATRASATKRCTKHWLILKPIFTSTYTWKTIFCFLGRLRWKSHSNKDSNKVRQSDQHFAGVEEEGRSPAQAVADL